MLSISKRLACVIAKGLAETAFTIAADSMRWSPTLATVTSTWTGSPAASSSMLKSFHAVDPLASNAALPNSFMASLRTTLLPLWERSATLIESL
ncbi:hypothetical protein D3C80_1931210 [compost metagenome]